MCFELSPIFFFTFFDKIKSLLCEILAGPAGSVDEDTFTKSFEDVPTVRIFSPREVSDHMKNIYDTISDSNKEWNKRVDAVSSLSGR